MHVSKSEYHGYVKRRKSNAQIEWEALEGFVAERFDLHKGRCGYRRIDRELRRNGIVVMCELTNGKGRKTRRQSGTRSSTLSSITVGAECTHQSATAPHAT